MLEIIIYSPWTFIFEFSFIYKAPIHNRSWTLIWLQFIQINFISNTLHTIHSKVFQYRSFTLPLLFSSTGSACVPAGGGEGSGQCRGVHLFSSRGRRNYHRVAEGRRSAAPQPPRQGRRAQVTRTRRNHVFNWRNLSKPAYINPSNMIK